MTGSRIFTDQKNVATARRMIANGMTDASVAAAFGVERSTIAWLRRRHKIPSARSRGKNEFRVAPSPPIIKGNTRLLKGAAWRALSDTEPVSLVDLEPGMCKWPIGDDRPYRFCGAPAHGPYCEHHAQIARQQ